MHYLGTFERDRVYTFGTVKLQLLKYIMFSIVSESDTLEHDCIRVLLTLPSRSSKFN